MDIIESHIRSAYTDFSTTVVIQDTCGHLNTCTVDECPIFNPAEVLGKTLQQVVLHIEGSVIDKILIQF